jgi:hypothetical protein
MTTDIQKVKNKLPDNVDVSEAAYEGSDIVIYVNTEKFFINHQAKVKGIVSEIKKRVDIRPSSDIFKPPSQARQAIEQIVPSNKDIIFQPELGKAIIKTKEPRKAKTAKIRKQIRQEALWKPEIEREPAIQSNIVDKARELTSEDPGFRKEFLNDIGKRIRRDYKEDGWARVTGLGGFRQVGRSSILVQTENSNILLDAGIDPSSTEGSQNNFPYLDAPELNIPQLDAVVLSHAHMDHMGMIPYLYRMGYDGPLYCTAPTRDLMIMQTLDYIDISHSEQASAPYESKHIKKAVKRTISLDYGQVADISPDVKLTLKNAGHILGSSLVHLHMMNGSHNLLYTGDYNYDKSEMLRQADTDFRRVETMITESTYGGRNDEQQPRKEAQKKFLSNVKQTLQKGGKVIVPAFAVGRSQEIIGTLADEIEHSYFDYNIYLDGMINDSNALHTAYPQFLSKKIQKKIYNDESPFVHNQIKSVGSHEERKQVFEDPNAIVITTSGMVTGGPIMSYLKKEAPREKNQLIFVGYQAEGTLGRKIQNGAEEVKIDGQKVKVNMSVDEVKGFSAHSDSQQITNFTRNLRDTPQEVFTNHGEERKCFQIASRLHKKLNISTSAPENLESNRLE